MNIRFSLAALALGAAATSALAETLVQWKLDEPAPPIVAAQGIPSLKWWVEKETPYTSSTDVPPAGMYRDQADRPINSFDAGASYGNTVCGLIASSPAEFWNVGDGLTVEGFFKTKRVKTDRERQAVISCGEGFADIAWIVRIVDGRPNFSVFQGTSPDPVAAVETDQEVRDERWYYFAARVVPGSPAKISLTVKGEGDAAVSAQTDLPAGFSIRQNRKALIVGRSSLYIDPKPEYRGTWDSFAGQISGLRISRGALPDGELLGKTAQ